LIIGVALLVTGIVLMINNRQLAWAYRSVGGRRRVQFIDLR